MTASCNRCAITPPVWFLSNFEEERQKRDERSTKCFLIIKPREGVMQQPNEMEDWSNRILVYKKEMPESVTAHPFISLIFSLGNLFLMAYNSEI